MLSPNGFFIDELPNRLPNFTLQKGTLPTDLTTDSDDNNRKKTEITITGSGILREIFFNGAGRLGTTARLRAITLPDKLEVTIDGTTTIVFQNTRSNINYTLGQNVTPFGFLVSIRGNIANDHLPHTMKLPLRFFESLIVTFKYVSTVSFSSVPESYITYGLENV